MRALLSGARQLDAYSRWMEDGPDQIGPGCATRFKTRGQEDEEIIAVRPAAATIPVLGGSLRVGSFHCQHPADGTRPVRKPPPRPNPKAVLTPVNGACLSS